MLYPFTRAISIAAIAFSLILQANAADTNKISAELAAADNAWLSESPAAAIEKYRTVLDSLSKNDEFIRPTIIMRVARAELEAGNKQKCLDSLKLLEPIPYVQEHIRMAAAELKARAQGKTNPGLAKTPIPPIDENGKTLFVSKKAKQNGDGSREHPFNKLSDAINAAIKLETQTRRSIVIDTGVYTMNTPIVLKNMANLTIRSANPAEPATLTGGVVLRKWSHVSSPEFLEKIPETAKTKALQCDLSDNGAPKIEPLVFAGFSSQRAKGGNHRFKTMPVPELFNKRTPLTMATWPNKGYTKLPVLMKPKKNLERYQRWAKETNLWLHGYWKHSWADAYEKVESIDENGSITPAKPVNSYGFGQRMGRAVNALCELDSPGEWYFDSKTNKVVLFPPENFNPEQCVLSAFKTPIQAENCGGLRIRDIKIDFVRGDAISVENCDNLLLENLRISECSGLGIRVKNGENVVVHSCSISNMGRGGMDILSGDWQKLRPGNSVIENCEISNLSRIDRTYTPAILLEGMGLKVQHNEFKDIPSSAIRLEACDALVQLNVFRRCVYESGDQGAIDMWGNPLYRGNVFRWNFFDSIKNPNSHFGAAAVRCDDHVSGTMIDRNIMLHGTNHGFGAAQFNMGKDNFTVGNIIIDWNTAYSGRSMGGKRWSNRLNTHKCSKAALNTTNWQSDAWKKKYPKIATLLDGANNHNYFIANTLVNVKKTKSVKAGIFIADREIKSNDKIKTLDDTKKFVTPWAPIPFDEIGPYKR
jgi:hypothetical protein